jgi:hypothetical protein
MKVTAGIRLAMAQAKVADIKAKLSMYAFWANEHLEYIENNSWISYLYKTNQLDMLTNFSWSDCLL